MHFVRVKIWGPELRQEPSDGFSKCPFPIEPKRVACICERVGVSEGFNLRSKSVCSFFFSFGRNVECLNLLLSSGTDLNKRDIMGR